MGGWQNDGPCRKNNRDPKRDHNFDNHPYTLLNIELLIYYRKPKYLIIGSF